MVNLRPKPKAKVVAPRTTAKTEQIPSSPKSSDDLEISEGNLRKLSRAELQKLAMAHKVKANMKSESIIRELLSLQVPKRTRPAEGVCEEGPSREKRLKRKVASEEATIPPTHETQGAQEETRPINDTPSQPSGKDPQLPEAEPSGTTPPVQRGRAELSYDKELFSGTESDMTEEEQPDYVTPISSRSGTPPASNVLDLQRCVTIMQEISAQDVVLLKEVAQVRETAARLRKRARDVRDLVKAEKGRRERMEAYFRYWQESGPTWDRVWLYGEKKVPGDLDEPAEPGRPPTPSPGELKQRREAIVSKQAAEQRELAQRQST